MSAWGPDRGHGAGLGANECPNFFGMATTSVTSNLRRSTPKWMDDRSDDLRAGSASGRSGSRTRTPGFNEIRDGLLKEADGRMGVIEQILDVRDKTGHVKRYGSLPDFLEGHRRRRKLHDWRVLETWRAAQDRIQTPPNSQMQTPSSSRAPSDPGGAGPERWKPLPLSMKYACHPPTRSDPVRYASSIYRPLGLDGDAVGDVATLGIRGGAGSTEGGSLAKPKTRAYASLSRYTAHPATRSDAVRFAGNLYRPLPGSLQGTQEEGGV